jgi:hypothetical protein
LLVSLPEPLPDGMKKMVLDDCELLCPPSSLLPASLKDVHVGACPKIKSLPEPLPCGMLDLSIDVCCLSHKLPKSLQKVAYGDSDARLPEPLPETLCQLRLFRCSWMTVVPSLPVCLCTLVLTDCKELASLPQLPEGLQELMVTFCGSITEIPGLPAGLQRLTLRNVPVVSLSPPLPLTLRTLELDCCTNLVSVPLPLPEGLHDLTLGQCFFLNTLPILTALPRGLMKLILRADMVQTLANLPPNLRYLSLTGCERLTTLITPLPEDMRVLRVVRCFRLSHLPTLGCALDTLEVESTPIQSLPQPLPATLRRLALRWTSVSSLPYPLPPELRCVEWQDSR